DSPRHGLPGVFVAGMHDVDVAGEKVSALLTLDVSDEPPYLRSEGVRPAGLASQHPPIPFFEDQNVAHNCHRTIRKRQIVSSEPDQKVHLLEGRDAEAARQPEVV